MNRVWTLFIRDRRITQQVLILSIAYLSPSFNGPCEGASIANRGAYKIPVDSKGVQGWVSGMAIYIFLWSWNAVNVEDSFVRSFVRSSSGWKLYAGKWKDCSEGRCTSTAAAAASPPVNWTEKCQGDVGHWKALALATIVSKAQGQVNKHKTVQIRVGIRVDGWVVLQYIKSPFWIWIK